MRYTYTRSKTGWIFFVTTGGGLTITGVGLNMNGLIFIGGGLTFINGGLNFINGGGCGKKAVKQYCAFII